MSKELTLELKKQISDEAEGNTRDFRDNNDYEAGVIKGYMEGYEVAGENYAFKWQQAEAMAARYEKALKEIQAKARKTISPAQACADFDRYITDLFTHKQTTDDTANG